MRSLVTGGTGFIGASVVRALVERGESVRVLVRAESDRRNLDGLPVELAIGDVRDATSVARAMVGCRRVFHVAALYSFWAPASLVEAVNVDGTRTVLEAARAAGVETVVHTSSVATIGAPLGGGVADETFALSPGQVVGAYKRSKVRAEQEALAAARRGLRVVIVNPSFPVGPGDIKPTPTGRVIVDFLNGRMPAYVQTGLNVVDVRDVAAGHILAAERGKSGERYILGGVNMTMRDLLAALARASGRNAPWLQLPHGVVATLAGPSEWVAWLLGREPRLTRDTVRMSRHTMFYSSEKAVGELGWPQSSAKTALADAVGWFRANGYVHASRRQTRPE